MKKLLFISCSILFVAAILFSCKKNAADVSASEPATEAAAVSTLNHSESFTEFSKAFVPDLYAFLKYHKAITTNKLENIFIDQVKAANDDESRLAVAYQSVSLNFETAILLKNKIDNDILKLLNQNKFLLKFDEAAVNRILFNTLQLRVDAKDPDLQLSLKDIQPKIPAVAAKKRIVNMVDEEEFFDPSLDLTLNEVWECMKKAAGFGTGTVLGIAGLQKLATEGIQEVVITMSKWLAKRAGWIGAAVMLIDFSSCIYVETKD